MVEGEKNAEDGRGDGVADSRYVLNGLQTNSETKKWIIIKLVLSIDMGRVKIKVVWPVSLQ